MLHNVVIKSVFPLPHSFPSLCFCNIIFLRLNSVLELDSGGKNVTVRILILQKICD